MVFSGNQDYVSYLRSSSDYDTIKQRITNLIGLQQTSVMRLRKIYAEDISRGLPTKKVFGPQSALADRMLSDLSLTDVQIEQMFNSHKEGLLLLFQTLATLDKSSTRIVYSFNNIKVYTNSEQTIEIIAQLPIWHKFYANKIETVLNPGEYSRATVEYKYRTYFKPQQVSPEDLTALVSHVAGLAGARCSPALLKASNRHTLYKSRVYLRSHFYIEYNNPAEVSFLRLMFPALLTRTISFVEK